MIIKTCVGEFENFKDIRTHMIVENLQTIEIYSVLYWGIPVLSKGYYSLPQIDFIINAQ